MTNLRCVVCGAAEDMAFLCNRCTDALERHLAELPSLFAELLVTETRQGRTYRAGGRSEREPEPAYDPEADVEPRLRSKGGRIALRGFALPYDEAASVLRDECWTTVTTWARHLSETRGVEIPAPQRWPRRRTLVIERNRAAGWLTEWTEPTEAEVQSALCVWLVAHVDAVRMDEAAAEMVDEIADVHRRLTRAVDNSPGRVFWGRCDALTNDDDNECGRELYAKHGANSVICDGFSGDGEGCGATRPTDAVRARIRSLTEQAMVSISEVLHAAGLLFPEGHRMPGRNVINGWITPKDDKPAKLIGHGKNNRGEILYRGVEVLHMIDRYRPHRDRREDAA